MEVDLLCFNTQVEFMAQDCLIGQSAHYYSIEEGLQDKDLANLIVKG